MSRRPQPSPQATRVEGAADSSSSRTASQPSPVARPPDRIGCCCHLGSRRVNGQIAQFTRPAVLSRHTYIRPTKRLIALGLTGPESRSHTSGDSGPLSGFCRFPRLSCDHWFRYWLHQSCDRGLRHGSQAARGVLPALPAQGSERWSDNSQVGHSDKDRYDWEKR